MPSVLLVDDSSTQAMYYQKLVASFGHEVRTVGSGEAALEAVAEALPDIVLTDLQMPGLTGIELSERLVALYPGLPIVLMTGFGSEDMTLEALRAGASYFVRKQKLVDEIDTVIKNLSGRSRQLHEQGWAREHLTEVRHRYTFGTDPAEITRILSQIEENLLSLGPIDQNIRLRIVTALREALENAIYHGNLEVDSALRELPEPTYYSLADQRATEEPYRQRRTHVTVEVTREHFLCAIEDEGPGFDPSTLPDPTHPDNLGKASGRGLLLITTFMDDVSHNETGNRITLTKRLVSNDAVAAS